MSSTLIDSVRSVFTDSLLSKCSILEGESESNMATAVRAAIPLVLTDILHKSRFPEPAKKIVDLSRQAAAGDFFGELHELNTSQGGLLPGSVLLNKGTGFARSLFGPRTDFVFNEVSRWASISIPAATFITGIVSFAALDAIGRHIANNNADSKHLTFWLKSQSESVTHRIPAGLQIKEAVGIERYPWEVPVRRSRNSALYIMLALLVIVALIFVAYRHAQHSTATNTIPADTAASTVVSPDSSRVAGTPADTAPPASNR